MFIQDLVEITAESEQSLEDATRIGMGRLDAVQVDSHQAWIEDQQVVVRDGRPAVFRVDMTAKVDGLGGFHTR